MCEVGAEASLPHARLKPDLETVFTSSAMTCQQLVVMLQYGPGMRHILEQELVSPLLAANGQCPFDQAGGGLFAQPGIDDLIGNFKRSNTCFTADRWCSLVAHGFAEAA